LASGSLVVPYLLFNLWLSGTPMPNTFYAKQAEYASSLLPWPQRIGVLFLQLFNGPSVVLLPGIVGWAVQSIRKREWPSIASMLWCGGYLFLYISRLPAINMDAIKCPPCQFYFCLDCCFL